MKKILLIATFYITVCLGANAGDDSFSIYLVRHAEKQSDKENPSLTTCGTFRANQLAILLERVNVEHIYSTPYKRTMETAKPTATKNNISIKSYSPKHLSQLSLQLKQRRKNSLIVGHSNTTPLLVELLSGQSVAKLSENDYQMLYQLQFTADESILTVLTQPLACK